MSDQPQTPKPTIPPVGEWLCKKAFDASNLTYSDDETETLEWDELPPDIKRLYWDYAQCVLATMLGIEVTEMILAGKAEVLATAKAFDRGGDAT